MPAAEPDETHVVELDGVDVAVEGVPILHDIDWRIRGGERWVIVGPNGAGKTTLLRLVSGWIRPTRGRAVVLGDQIGRTDLRELRTRIGYASQALSDQLRSSMTAHEVVLAAPNAALETWWHTYDPADHRRAAAGLELFGVDEAMARRPMRTLSAGERQRVMLARAFASQARLIVLDEPTAGLDVGGREDLVARLDRAATETDAALVLVTHHLEEIPPSFDRVLLVRDGRVAGAGSAEALLTSERLSALYGIDLDVSRVRGRWQARASGGSFGDEGA